MTKLISIENLTYTIPYGDTILKNINLDVSEGDFIGVLGHNGSGKTTLIDLLLGNKQKADGRLEILDEDPHSQKRRHKKEIVFLSQDVSIKGDITISDFLKFHSAFFPNYSKEDERYLISTFELSYDQKIGSLSTGQQKKVQIVAGFATRPKIIIIDEITAVLDPETRDIFFQELMKLKSNLGTGIILATNIAEDLIERADKVLFIENHCGTIHSPQEILTLFNIGQAA